ncbi:MAG: CynX/NimT family MFS transporter [Vulcanimicrobiaceae bacterium]
MRLRLGLLWLAGIDLRLTLLAIPPLIPHLHRDLPLDETEIALLGGIPVLLFALFASAGSYAVARVGARRTLVAGLVLIALFGALRGFGPSVAVLFAATTLMGVAIAAIQPAFPALVRSWTGERVGLGTAAYTSGLLFGEVIAAGLTLPLVLPLARESWGDALALWSLPVIATAVLVARIGPSVSAPPQRAGAWRPRFSDPLVWRLGLLQGGASIAYFGTNAFLPDFLVAHGLPGLVGAALATLNGSQLAASLFVALAERRVVGRRGPLVIAGLLSIAGTGVIALGGGTGVLFGAALVGAASAFVLVLTLALPPLIAAEENVAALSAGTFTVGYAVAFAVPLLGGAAWDLSHVPAVAFAPIALGGLAMTAMAAGLRVRGALAAAQAGIADLGGG